MNALLFGLMSTALMSVAVARGPEAVESNPVPAAHIEQIRAETTPARAEVSRAAMSEEAKAAADDLEVARLMAAAPDMGEFGESVIVDADTGVETRVYGIGFSDK